MLNHRYAEVNQCGKYGDRRNVENSGNRKEGLPQEMWRWAFMEKCFHFSLWFADPYVHQACSITPLLVVADKRKYEAIIWGELCNTRNKVGCASSIRWSQIRLLNKLNNCSWFKILLFKLKKKSRLWRDCVKQFSWLLCDQKHLISNIYCDTW